MESSQNHLSAFCSEPTNQILKEQSPTATANKTQKTDTNQVNLRIQSKQVNNKRTEASMKDRWVTLSQQEAILRKELQQIDKLFLEVDKGQTKVEKQIKSAEAQKRELDQYIEKNMDPKDFKVIQTSPPTQTILLSAVQLSSGELQQMRVCADREYTEAQKKVTQMKNVMSYKFTGDVEVQAEYFEAALKASEVYQKLKEIQMRKFRQNVKYYTERILQVENWQKYWMESQKFKDREPLLMRQLEISHLRIKSHKKQIELNTRFQQLSTSQLKGAWLNRENYRKELLIRRKKKQSSKGKYWSWPWGTKIAQMMGKIGAWAESFDKDAEQPEQNNSIGQVAEEAEDQRQKGDKKEQ